MGARSNRKGKAWEQAVNRLLRPLFGDTVHRGDQRGRGGAGAGEGCDCDGTPFWLEAKHGHQPSVAAALRQATAKRDEKGDSRPVVAVCKADARPPGWKVGRPLAPPTATMELADWLALVADWARLRRLAGEPIDPPAPIGVDPRNA